jgi:N-acetylglucosaminyldiphosphoundecaprenol N-acetyl-beta-D-mannosaminyltransferase
MSKIDVAGLKIDSITKQELLQQISARTKNGRKTFIITPYSEFLYRGLRDTSLLDVFNRADLAVPDGIGIIWAKKYLDIPLTAKSYWGKIFQAAWQIFYSLAAIMFNRKWVMSPFAEKIPGSDLIWDIANLAKQNNLSIFLLGGFGDTPKIVAQKLEQKTMESFFLGREKSSPVGKLKIVGFSNANSNNTAVIADIKKAGPDILLVAFGPVTQEKWIVDHMAELPAKVYIGLGGTFDYISGQRSTPPKFIRQIGLEWLYRLFTQPHRIKRIWQATFGLIHELWHYKIFLTYPIRPNVVAVIINQQGKVFLGKKSGTKVDIIKNLDPEKWKNYWQLPQGGIDGDEDIITDAKREIFEETGINEIEFLSFSQKKHDYKWNNAQRRFWQNRKYRYQGQSQTIAYFKFVGNPEQIHLPVKEEFEKYQWADPLDLDKIIHPDRINLTKIVQADLKNGLANGKMS